MRTILRRFDSEHFGFFRGTFQLTALTALGQLSYPLALPIIGHLYAVEDFGLFTIYMALVNISTPLITLKYDGAIYSCKTDRDLALRLRLVVSAILCAIVFWLFVFLLSDNFLSPEHAQLANRIAPFLPLGMLLGGGWDIATAWAVRRAQMHVLSFARMSQPLVLTAAHLGFGWLGWGANGLLVGSILSYTVYVAMIFAPRTNWSIFAIFKTIRNAEIWASVKEERNFPFYMAPAQLLTLLIANLPQLMIGLLFGQSAAGFYGLAYRLVAAPVQIVCMPLGNALISYLSSPNKILRMSMVYAATLFSFAVVALPVIAIGLASPIIVAWLLPEIWAGLDKYLTILAFGSAAQAMAVPFYDSYSLLRQQKAKLGIDIGRFVAAALALLVPASLGWTALETIIVLVVASALGFLFITGDATLRVRAFVRAEAE
jgi:O-antigen/teichoic acid export membrane protein